MTTETASGTAIIVGMSGSTGLAVVRALAREGVTCHATHYDAGAPAMATRLARTHQAPDWRSDPSGLIDFLLELAGRLGFGEDADASTAPSVASLFVCHDAALGPVWAADARLRAAGLRCAFRSTRPLAELLDKRVQLEGAARAGVAAPWTRWGAAAELEAAADECPYPAILKPAFSHLGVKALGAKALRCADAGELHAALAATGDVELLLQEYVPGGDDQLYTAGLFVCAGGHVAFTGRKLKQHPPGLGIARLAEAVDEPGLVPGGVALLAELGYEGISQVEYKRDERDGSFRLMEANFRPWTWLGLATACGANLPLAAHCWALGDEPRYAPAVGASAGRSRRRCADAGPKRWIWLVPEAAYTVRDLRRGVWPQFAQWRGLRAEAFFARTDPSPLRRTLEAALDARLQRWRAATRGVRHVARVALMVPAAAFNAAVLWADWRRTGRRSVAGGRPAVGLPGRGAVLVLAPHPDDEVLMCGATLAALRRRGDSVRVVALTKGGATAVDHSGAAPDPAPPAIRPPADPASPAAPPTGIGDVRVAELHAACAALGIDDVDLWDFTDGGLPGERERLTLRIREELERLSPGFVVVPFPYDAHADHVATALALADALAQVSGLRGADVSGAAGGAADLPRVLCAPVRMPFSPAWATRLVPAGGAWAARQAALAAYASRDRALFATPTLLARLHPARPLRVTESFVELAAESYVQAVRAIENRGLTVPAMRGGGHPVSMALKLLRTRDERDAVAAVLRDVAATP